MFLSSQTVQNLMKCRLIQNLIWVFTVCQSTCLQVSRMKTVKVDDNFISKEVLILEIPPGVPTYWIFHVGLDPDNDSLFT